MDGVSIDWVIEQLKKLEKETFHGTIGKRYKAGEGYLVDVTITLKP